MEKLHLCLPFVLFISCKFQWQNFYTPPQMTSTWERTVRWQNNYRKNPSWMRIKRHSNRIIIRNSGTAYLNSGTSNNRTTVGEKESKM